MFFTSTVYLTVAHPAWVLSKPLVTVAVLGASEDVTVTLLDGRVVKVELALIAEWPDAVTVSVTIAFSPWTAVKVHVPMALGAMFSAEQSELATVPAVPAVQARPVNPPAVKTLPYALSQIWSTISPELEEFVMATV